eukprot:6441379-Pyramimonas_sp.AAC.1
MEAPGGGEGDVRSEEKQQQQSSRISRCQPCSGGIVHALEPRNEPPRNPRCGRRPSTRTCPPSSASTGHRRGPWEDEGPLELEAEVPGHADPQATAAAARGRR